MGGYWEDGGYMMWPILICAILVVALAANTGSKLFRGEARALPEMQSGLDAVLFWGAFAVVLGVLGTVVGLIQMAQAIQLAGDVEPVLVWGGFGVSLVTTLFGLLVLSVALLVWFGLWVRYRRLVRLRPA